MDGATPLRTWQTSYSECMVIIDAWAQHPTARHRNHPMFDSLRRWTRGQPGSAGIATMDTAEWPVEITLAAMDAGKRRQKPDQRLGRAAG